MSISKKSLIVGLFVALCVSAASSRVLVSEASFDLEHYEGHAWFNDMVSNTLRNRVERESIEDKISSNQDRSYQILTTKSSSLLEAKEYVLEHLEVKNLAYDTKFNAIFTDANESLLSWHILSILDFESMSSVVGMFHYDRELQLFHLHIVRHAIKTVYGAQGIKVAYFVSHFGFPVEEDVHYFTEQNEHTNSQLREEVLNAMAKVAATRRISPTSLQSEQQFLNELKSQKGQLAIPPVIIAYAAKAILPYVFKVAQAVIKWFGVKRTKTIDQEIKGQGFRYYNLNCEILRQFGISPANHDKYFDYLAKRFTRSNHVHLEQIKANLAIAQYLPLSEWRLADTNIDIMNTNEDKFFSIMTNREEDGKLNFIMVDSKTTYRLTPNFIIWKETKSQFGGGFSEEKYTIEEYPRTVTEEEVTSIKLFNLMIATKMLHDDLTGQTFNFPNIE